jgi:hypothetical protein
MRTLFVVFVLALIAIAFEIYSDAALTSAEVPHAAPDLRMWLGSSRARSQAAWKVSGLSVVKSGP